MSLESPPVRHQRARRHLDKKNNADFRRAPSRLLRGGSFGGASIPCACFVGPPILEPIKGALALGDVTGWQVMLLVIVFGLVMAIVLRKSRKKTHRMIRIQLQRLLTIVRHSMKRELQDHPNPLTARGGKVYSQNDEDGITLEILRRIGRRQGVFAEFGVGDGTENNTLALAAAGWSGIWAGGEELAFDFNPGRAKKLKFHYQKQWITRSNIIDIYNKGMNCIQKSQCDLISLDLDGNDYYFVQTLLGAGISPDVFIVEYNGKFIPPLQFKIEYDDRHHWQKDDYFGASLATLADLFQSHDYFLACCNLTGVNAFFVKGAHREHFRDVPESIELLYASPKYFLSGLDMAGHPMSLRTIEAIFRRLNSDE